MLRYDRQTKPGLVALYDIWPGNGAGPFLQPRSPHGAHDKVISISATPDYAVGAENNNNNIKNTNIYKAHSVNSRS